MEVYDEQDSLTATNISLKPTVGPTSLASSSAGLTDNMSLEMIGALCFVTFVMVVIYCTLVYTAGLCSPPFHEQGGFHNSEIDVDDEESNAGTMVTLSTLRDSDGNSVMEVENEIICYV